MSEIEKQNHNIRKSITNSLTNFLKLDLESQIQNNRCPVCRIKRLTTCKCPVKAGNESNEKRKEDIRKSSISQQPTNPKPQPVPLAGPSETSTADTTQIVKADEIPLLPPLDNLVLEIIEPLPIENNTPRYTLTFRGNSKLSEEQQEALSKNLGTVKFQFEKFKSELAAKGVIVNNFTAVLDLKNSQLIISIPSLKDYQNFLKYLTNENLLPKVENNNSKEIEKPFNPTPLSISLDLNNS